MFATCSDCGCGSKIEVCFVFVSQGWGSVQDHPRASAVPAKSKKPREETMPQVAVITGANGLIGQATCRRLGQSGYQAVGIDIGADGAGNWPHYRCDLADLTQMAATLERIEREHGLIRVLFNNAGIYHPEKDYLDVPPEQYDATLAVNLRVPFFRRTMGRQAIDRRGTAGRDRQHRVDGRTQRQHRGRVRRLEGGGD
ncbi:MAG TPA: SDR family oxidoreductase [Acetobacteraceae bacterium]|nr:SDR family oxidoreductase [Acetobacteraceae bacterium]